MILSHMLEEAASSTANTYFRFSEHFSSFKIQPAAQRRKTLWLSVALPYNSDEIIILLQRIEAELKHAVSVIDCLLRLFMQGASSV